MSGNRGPRLVDIAAAAGVHHSTVSRVLNGDPAQSVRPETHDRILRAARQQGYRPNALARALKRSRTGAIGFVVPLLPNPVWARIERSPGADVLVRQPMTLITRASAGPAPAV